MSPGAASARPRDPENKARAGARVPHLPRHRPLRPRPSRRLHAPPRPRALTCRVPATGAGRGRPPLSPARAAPGPRAKARPAGPRPRRDGPRPLGQCSPPAPCGGSRCYRRLPSPATAEGQRAEHARSHCPAPREPGTPASVGRRVRPSVPRPRGILCPSRRGMRSCA